MKIIELLDLGGMEDYSPQPTDVCDALDADGSVLFSRDDEPYAIVKPVSSPDSIPGISNVPDPVGEVLKFIQAADEKGLGITLRRVDEHWEAGYITATGGGELTSAPTIAEAAGSAVFALPQRDN